MNFIQDLHFVYFNLKLKKMKNYKLKLSFNKIGPQSRKYTVWICDGKGADGLPCGYESEKDRTVRHYAAVHLKIKHSQQPKIAVLLRDYDIRISRGITYENVRKPRGKKLKF